MLQKKATKGRLFLNCPTKPYGLVGPSLSLPAAITIPAMIAAAARIPTITPLPPPSLLSSFDAAPARFDFAAEAAFEAVAAEATTGALISDATAIAASETLPKRII
jgi:hypothetical protein